MEHDASIDNQIITGTCHQPTAFSTNSMDTVVNKLEQKHELTLPWPAYALGWSNVAPNPRLFVGSFLVSSFNSIHGIDLHLSEAETGGNLSYRPSCTSPTDGLPVSQIVCQPSKHGLVDGGEELVAASSDAVRLWRAFLPEADNQLAAIQAAEKGLTAPPPGMVLVAELANRRQSQRAPLTGLDWAAADSRLLITSSIDTTCTVWDLEASKIKTQLIAHDRSVLDVQSANGQSDIFGSAGEDGSVRLFDLRSLDQSTILFESGDTSGKEGSASPLLRLRFNKSDENYLAVLEMGSLSALVLDVRMPGVQVARLCGHTTPPTSLAWHPLSRNHLVTGGNSIPNPF
ncbi:hypothetical protein DSO57_1036939 [Entomophthora muscae]|uniref:Uncharacterized protein n=1 Tax=Entomophthora muscae TaxID=34485 RepID=A0ACC2TLK3_9FUNG|nr:hypothetical protein DSO57_1036939 [Entomophthora muscae]